MMTENLSQQTSQKNVQDSLFSDFTSYSDLESNTDEAKEPAENSPIAYQDNRTAHRSNMILREASNLYPQSRQLPNPGQLASNNKAFHLQISNQIQQTMKDLTNSPYVTIILADMGLAIH